jgi:hypothetical protein
MDEQQITVPKIGKMQNIFAIFLRSTRVFFLSGNWCSLFIICPISNSWFVYLLQILGPTKSSIFDNFTNSDFRLA